MGWSAQYFTTIIIEGNTPQTGIFIYSGVPQSGNLIGSWAAQAGTDAFGNTYPAGINVFQGQLSGVGINQATINAGSILAAALSQCTFNNGTLSNDQISQSTYIMNSAGGVILGYTTTTTTTTLTAGTTTWPGALNGTASVSCWGSGASGSGGSATEGAETGGGGEWANEPAYPISTANTYSVTIPNGGASVITGETGNPGFETVFDQGQLSGSSVIANGGTNGANFQAGKGGSGSTNTNHFNGGNGANGSSSTGGSSGGNSGCPTAAGNNGIQGSSSSGAASPTAQSGGGQGGAGGANGGNGTGGGTPGGAGGGAGAGNQPTQVTETFKANATWSYYASEGLRNQNGTCYHGYYGDPNNWEYFYWTFGFSNLGHALNSVLSGSFGTINSVKLTLPNQHSWYDSGMYWGLHSSTVLGAGEGGYSVILNPGGTHINEGATQTYNLTSSQYSPFSTGTFTYWVLAPDSNDINNLNWYGYFAGQGEIELTVVYTTSGSGSTTSGAGGNGQITLTYSATTALALSASPVATTDAFSNAIPAGFAQLNPDGSYCRLRAEATDFSTTTIPSTETTLTQCTKTWSIPANDPIGHTGYRIRYWGTLTLSSVVQGSALNWRGNFTGAGGLGKISIGADAFDAASVPCEWVMESTIIIQAVGTSVAYSSFSTLMLSAANVNLLNTSGSQSTIAGCSTGGAISGIDTEAVMDMWGEFSFATSSAGQTLTCEGSTFTPIGP